MCRTFALFSKALHLPLMLLPKDHPMFFEVKDVQTLCRTHNEAIMKPYVDAQNHLRDRPCTPVWPLMPHWASLSLPSCCSTSVPSPAEITDLVMFGHLKPPQLCGVENLIINRRPSFVLNHSDLGGQWFWDLNWCTFWVDEMAADQNCVHRNWDDVCSMEKDWADDLWLKVEKTEKKKHDIWSDVAAKARNNHLYSSQAYGFVGKWGTPFHPLVSNYGAFSAWNAVVFLQKRHKIARPSTASGTSVAPPPSLLLSCRLYLVHLLAYVTLNQTWLAAGGNSLFPELNGYLNRKIIYTSRRMSGDGRMSLSYFFGCIST